MPMPHTLSLTLSLTLSKRYKKADTNFFQEKKLGLTRKKLLMDFPCQHVTFKQIPQILLDSRAKS